MSRIVVGVDGSANAARALAWAVEEAALRGTGIRAVYAFRYEPVGWAVAFEPAPIPAVPLEEVQRYAEKALEEALAEVIDVNTHVDIERVVVEGPAARRLLEHAEDADLLVVGSRGLGGFRGLLLGSVSHQVVTHAPCPVVVVGPPED